MRKAAFLAAPLALYLAAFFYAPLVYLALEGARGEGLVSAYIEALTRPEYHVFYTRSLVAATLATLIAGALAVPPAFYAAYYSAGKEKMLVVVLMIAPFWIDVLLRALALKVLLRLVGVGPGFGAMVAGLAYEVLPLMFIAAYVGAAFTPRNMIDAARTLGAGPLQAFLRVILPLSAPWLAAGAAISFIYAFSDYTIPSLLGGTTGYTVGTLLYILVLEGDRWGVGSAVAIVVTLATMAGAALLFKRVYRVEAGW
ncbi:MAG: ABC transporter permease subunit [Desulfurococcales archaeon]|nr:ABC transporter permease subunit [Desulfurococcales archaeon]